MSARTLARLAAVLGVLLLLWAAAALAHRRSISPSAARFRLPAMTRSSVDSIRITRPADTLVLTRRDSAWSVNGHPALASAVSELFSALSDTTASAELVAEQRTSHAGLGVDSAGGTRVRFLRGGSVVADLVAGHRSMDLDGGYFRMANSDEVYLLRGPLAGVLDRGRDEWRDRRIATVPVDSVSAIEVRRGSRAYRMAKGDKGWVLVPGGPADTAAARRFIEAFREIDAAGFATPAQADSARFDRPDREVRLVRKDGAPLFTVAFDSMSNGFWARTGSGGTVYRLDGWAVNRLTPADSTLKPHPPPPPKKS
jgi:hypothetical protein